MRDWKSIKKGDILVCTREYTDTYGSEDRRYKIGETFEVSQVEDLDYEGCWSIHSRDNMWVNHEYFELYVPEAKDLKTLEELLEDNENLIRYTLANSPGSDIEPLMKNNRYLKELVNAQSEF